MENIDENLTIKEKRDLGRNLPVAVFVGFVIALILFIEIMFFPTVFIIFLVLMSTLGVWELVRAFKHDLHTYPTVPVYLATIALPLAAYFTGSEGLWLTFVFSVIIILVWRVLESKKEVFTDVFSAIFVVSYVPFLLSFIAIFLNQYQGYLRVLLFFAFVIANDTFGYIAGVFFGKHPMLSKVSPKKSWEGFIGSVTSATVIGIVGFMFFLEGSYWWVGAIMGFVVAVFATLGDFSESLIKRELGIKDMSSLLPGHGGLMERLDSILFAAPVAYIMFTVFLP